MVSRYHNVVTRQRYFDGESRDWRGFSLVTFRIFLQFGGAGLPFSVKTGFWGGVLSS
jgi:hypothetical protein